MENIIEVFTSNWEWVLLGFMVCEKLVKISPTKADDIMLDVVWNGIKKLVNIKKK